MVKLKQPTVHRALQNAVVATINDPDYSFSLPQISDWESIVSSSVDEKQRLEFVGDAIMHLSVALYLYRLFPDATPGFYTNIRSAMNTNATFTHLMVKAGAYELPSQSHSTKAVADSFEVIVAALYMERGFQDVCTWVQEQYAPLIAAARESYDKCHSTPSSSNKRRADTLGPGTTPSPKKTRLSGSRGMPRSVLMAQHVIKRMRSKGKVKLCLPTKKPKPTLHIRLRSRKHQTARSLRPPSIVIDLTVDSVSDSEVPASSNVTQASQSDLRPLISQNQPSLPGPTLEPSQSPKNANSPYLSRQGSMPPLGLPHKVSESPAPDISYATATSPEDLISTASLAALGSFERSSLSVPLLSNGTYGTYENPIVIEDSDIES